MIIDQQKRFCYVHIPGTAGMSVKAFLPSISDSCEQSSFRAFNTLASKIDLLTGYTTACIVRNPYDRMVSIFMRMHREFPLSVCGFPLTPQGFERFVVQFVKPILEKQDKEDPVYTNVLMPMRNFVEVNNNVAIDHILHYETLHADLASLLTNVYNVSYSSDHFPTVNMSSKTPLTCLGPIIYAEFYNTSSIASSTVESLYACDFTTFDYEIVSDWSQIPIIPKAIIAHQQYGGTRPMLDTNAYTYLQNMLVDMVCLLMKCELGGCNKGSLYNLAVFVTEKLHRLYGLDATTYKRTNIDFMDAIDFMNMADFVRRALSENIPNTIVNDAYVDAWISQLAQAIREIYPNLQDIWTDDLITKVKGNL